MSSLVRLQLITVVGDDHIDLPRYKCAVDFEFVSTVARLVAKKSFWYVALSLMFTEVAEQKAVKASIPVFCIIV
jgi:hypothetical protein